MRLFSSIIAFLFGFTLWSQSYQLGENYFDQGEFEKAQTVFEKLVAQNSRDLRSVQKLVATYQELEKYKLAEDLLLQQNKPKVIYPNLLVSLGYNYQLQDNKEAAQEACGRLRPSPPAAALATRRSERVGKRSVCHTYIIR